ncbi:methylmalonyl-CoA epimerase [Balneola sp. MJW-20]|uniref:methylmalonyl-CoA epimerase n=1 Tax=Gracilimonas aurantiaca TaxID=3234185 RepID=UPI003467351D
MHIDHIGIAVKDLEKATETYRKILNADPTKTEVVESEKVETIFFQTGESKVELLGGTSEDSVITKYVNKNGEGLHHVAFEVEDIKAELKRLAGEGFTILNEEPKKGADNKLVAFIHPKDNNGVLVELCQSISR